MIKLSLLFFVTLWLMVTDYDDTQAQIAELQKVLESFHSIESEVEVLRKQKSALEEDMEHAAAATRQGSGGLLSWLSGAPRSS